MPQRNSSDGILCLKAVQGPGMVRFQPHGRDQSIARSESSPGLRRVISTAPGMDYS